MAPSLSPESIAEFRRIFREKYGKEMTDAEASEAAHNLVSFFELLYRMDQERQVAPPTDK